MKFLIGQNDGKFLVSSSTLPIYDGKHLIAGEGCNGYHVCINGFKFDYALTDLPIEGSTTDLVEPGVCPDGQLEYRWNITATTFRVRVFCQGAVIRDETIPTPIEGEQDSIIFFYPEDNRAVVGIGHVVCPDCLSDPLQCLDVNQAASGLSYFVHHTQLLPFPQSTINGGRFVFTEDSWENFSSVSGTMSRTANDGEATASISADYDPAGAPSTGDLTMEIGGGNFPYAKYKFDSPGSGSFDNPDTTAATTGAGDCNPFHHSSNFGNINFNYPLQIEAQNVSFYRSGRWTSLIRQVDSNRPRASQLGLPYRDIMPPFYDITFGFLGQSSTVRVVTGSLIRTPFFWSEGYLNNNSLMESIIDGSHAEYGPVTDPFTEQFFRGYTNDPRIFGNIFPTQATFDATVPFFANDESQLSYGDAEASFSMNFDLANQGGNFNAQVFLITLELTFRRTYAWFANEDRTNSFFMQNRRRVDQRYIRTFPAPDRDNPTTTISLGPADVDFFNAQNLVDVNQYNGTIDVTVTCALS